MLDAVGVGVLPILLLGLLVASLFGGDGGSDTGGGELGTGDSGDGGPGDDEPDLTTGPDIYAGNDGNDIINGLDGNDSLEGNRGDDTIDGGEGDDEIDGGSGNDTISDVDGDNTINGGDGDDLIDVDGGDNTVFGGPGDDFITTGSGAAVVNGGEGDDEISVGDAEARAFGNEGDDTLVDEGRGAFMSGGAGDDALGGIGGRYAGDDGNDILVSLGEANEGEEDTTRTALVGGEGDDQMWATAGGTTQLTGGEGDDEMLASGSAFVFDFNPGVDTLELIVTFDGEVAGDTAPVPDDFEVEMSQFLNDDDEPVTVVTFTEIGDANESVTNAGTQVLLRGVSMDDISEDDVQISVFEESDLLQVTNDAIGRPVAVLNDEDDNTGGPAPEPVDDGENDEPTPPPIV